MKAAGIEEGQVKDGLTPKKNNNTGLSLQELSRAAEDRTFSRSLIHRVVISRRRLMENSRELRTTQWRILGNSEASIFCKSIVDPTD